MNFDPKCERTFPWLMDDEVYTCGRVSGASCYIMEMASSVMHDNVEME